MKQFTFKKKDPLFQTLSKRGPRLHIPYSSVARGKGIKGSTFKLQMVRRAFHSEQLAPSVCVSFMAVDGCVTEDEAHCQQIIKRPPV